MVPDRLNSRAVLVGTATYTEGLPQMPQASANLTDLFDALVDTIDPSGMVRFTDPTSASMVLNRLDGFARTRLDLLLFYYVGHGLRDGGDRLCLGLPGSIDNPHDAGRTSLPLDSVCDIMKRAAARHRVLILDCCYSGLAMDSPPAADLHLLTATDRTTKASFSETARNTGFTGELLPLLGLGLDLGSIYRRLDDGLRSGGFPAPRQRCVNRSADLCFHASA